MNIFGYEWKAAGQRVTVRDPLYGEEHKFSVCAVTIDGQTRAFAAGEFCMCVWGFYVETIEVQDREGTLRWQR